jgi:hypothetical protein
MVNYLERVRAEHARRMADQQAKIQAVNQRANAQWSERLTPLEQRLKKLLAEMPEETLAQGISLDSLRRLLAGKWRGNCHPGELGEALRKLHFIRRRSWSDDEGGFRAKWYPGAKQ